WSSDVCSSDLGQSETDGYAGKPTVCPLVRRSQNDDKEKRGQHKFGNECCCQTITLWRQRSITVSGKRSSHAVINCKTALAGSDAVQNCRSGYSAEHLCNNVRHQLLFVKTPSDHQAKGNRRIEMTSRNVPNRISHS